MKWSMKLAIVMLMICGSVFAKTTTTTKSVSASTQQTDTTFTDEKPNIVLNNKQTQFMIKLKSNPTTGYSWFLRDYDENLLVPVKHGREAATGGLIGAPGYETFTFKVKSLAVPQETSLRFVYMRPWTGIENSSQSVFHVTLMGK